MTNAKARPEGRIMRMIGVTLAVAIALLQATNAARAFLDPSGFATYLGLPLADARDAGLVAVYGLRALFIACFVAALLARSEFRALRLMALAAIVMPVGDAFLTHQAGAPFAIVARHGAIAIYLIATATILQRGFR
jgi:hypothetical protein